MGYLLDKLDQAALANQQDVVRNERRQSDENPPYGLVEEALVQRSSRRAPLLRVVIGSHEDIQAAKLETCAASSSSTTRRTTPRSRSSATSTSRDQEAGREVLRHDQARRRRAADHGQHPGDHRRAPRGRHGKVELPRVYIAWITPPFFKPGDAEADVGAHPRRRQVQPPLQVAGLREEDRAGVSAQQSLHPRLGLPDRRHGEAGHTAEELETAIVAELDAAGRKSPGRRARAARKTIETDIVISLEAGRVATCRPDEHVQPLHGDAGLSAKGLRALRDGDGAAAAVVAKQRLTQTPAFRRAGGAGRTDAAAKTRAERPTAARQATKSSMAPSRGATGAEARAAATAPLATPRRTLRERLTLILIERRGLPLVAASLVFRTGSAADRPTSPGSPPSLRRCSTKGRRPGTRCRSPTKSQAGREPHLRWDRSVDGQLRLVALALQGGRGDGHGAARRRDRASSRRFPRPTPSTARVRNRRGDAAAAEGQSVPRPRSPSPLSVPLYGANHPYGHVPRWAPTRRWPRSNAPDELVAFWRAGLSYAPQNAALILAGDLTMGRRGEGAGDEGVRKLARHRRTPRAGRSPRRRRCPFRAGRDRRQVGRAADGPGASPLRSSACRRKRHRTTSSINVINQVLGGLCASRINMNLRERERLHVRREVADSRSGGNGGPFTIGAGVRTDATAPAVTRDLQGGRGHHREAGHRRAAAEGEGCAGQLASRPRSRPARTRSTASRTSSSTTWGSTTTRVTPQQVNAVTAAQALDVAKKYILPGRLVVIAVGDRAAIEAELRKLNLGPVEVRDAEGRPVS